MSLTQVDFHFLAPDGRELSGATVQVLPPREEQLEYETGVIVPGYITLETDEEGRVSTNLVPSDFAPYEVIVSDWETNGRFRHRFYVPASTIPIQFHDLLVNEMPIDIPADDALLKQRQENQAALAQGLERISAYVVQGDALVTNAEGFKEEAYNSAQTAEGAASEAKDYRDEAKSYRDQAQSASTESSNAASEAKTSAASAKDDMVSASQAVATVNAKVEQASDNADRAGDSASRASDSADASASSASDSAASAAEAKGYLTAMQELPTGSGSSGDSGDSGSSSGGSTVSAAPGAVAVDVEGEAVDYAPFPQFVIKPEDGEFFRIRSDEQGVLINIDEPDDGRLYNMIVTAGAISSYTAPELYFNFSVYWTDGDEGAYVAPDEDVNSGKEHSFLLMRVPSLITFFNMETETEETQLGYAWYGQKIAVLDTQNNAAPYEYRSTLGGSSMGGGGPVVVS